MTKIEGSKLEAELKIFVTRFARFYINGKSVQLNTVFFGCWLSNSNHSTISKYLLIFFLENGTGIFCFSFPWSNLLPTRWGKNQLTPSEWPMGCRLPKWCGGRSILTKKAVQELELFGQFGVARIRAGYSDETLMRKMASGWDSICSTAIYANL